MSLRRPLALALVGSFLLAAPTALAQEQDPTLNESDFDSEPPASDESYLDESASAGSPDPASTEPDPELRESDFDMGIPAADESYLDEAEGAPQAEARSKVPFPGALVVGAFALAALALRRR